MQREQMSSIAMLEQQDARQPMPRGDKDIALPSGPVLSAAELKRQDEAADQAYAILIELAKAPIRPRAYAPARAHPLDVPASLKASCVPNRAVAMIPPLCGPGVDYETQSGSLSFAPADGSGTVTVKVCGEAVYERDQTFLVNLSNPSAATIADGQGLGTIINDDSAPVLNIGNVSAAEGNSGTTDFSFSVTKSGQTEVDAIVDFATAPGTTNPATAGGACTAGVDYESKTGTLTIAAAMVGGSIVVKVCGDSVFELEQTFQVNLTNPTDATIGNGAGAGVITNDDAAPTLSITDVTQAEGDSGDDGLHVYRDEER